MPTVSLSIPENNLEKIFAVAFAPIVALSELIKNSSDSCYIKMDVIKIYIEEDKQRIRIIDNGYGFSADDISKLELVTTSSKMSSSNKLSRIDEYYAGSKGQGIFTAFNLCTDLEIKTFSREDNKSYHIKWKAGTAKIIYEEVNEEFEGTELILKNVDDVTFKMITGHGEPQKLISSTILYYKDSKSLPNIELYHNDVLISPEINKKIEAFYNNNIKKTGSKGFFIAKAKFSYNNNRLKISYQDNETGIFNFNDVSLDLSDDNALKEFVRDKGITLGKAQEVYEGLEKFSTVKLNSFSGAFYVWVHKTSNELTHEYGVRVYINNYGLYNFLNKDNDWLGLSQISQNRKATSYKLKNTFGYVHFNKFDEGSSALKISNDRNSFMVGLASKKFEFLMKNVITNIFASLDIEIRSRKLNPTVIFEDKSSIPALYVDEPFNFKKLIKVSAHLSLNNIDTKAESNFVSISKDSDEITVSEAGQYQIRFTYNGETISKKFYVVERDTAFELVKKPPKIVYGTNYQLRKLINKSSLKNLLEEEIEISCKDAIIQKGLNLSPKNNPGDYKIEFKALKHGVDLAQNITVTIERANTKEVEKLNKRFSTINKYPKINDIIRGISENYVLNPTFAGIAIRTLVEISLKAFAYEFYSTDEINKMNNDKAKFSPEQRMRSLFDKLRNGSSNVDTRILSVFGSNLRGSQKKVIKAYKDIEPNDNIHGLQSAVTGKHVFDTMSVLSILINFIIESINSKPVIN